jgi:hypothetical protein
MCSLPYLFSRQEAIEHAQDLLRDYDGSIGIELVSPMGAKDVHHARLRQVGILGETPST